MQSLTRIAVITNAFIIAITSDFIPQLVYKYSYSPSGNMQGYVNFTLSFFNTTDLDTGKTSLATDIPEICRSFQSHTRLMILNSIFRYSGYYKPPWSEEKYEYDQEFWHIWFVRLVFVV